MSAVATMPSPTSSAASQPLTNLLNAKRTLVMGVLNVTPDSFSDGGRHLDPDSALAQARRMVGEGADIVDVGAESTRPYGDARPVSLEEEKRRLQPVLPGITALGVPVSIDTMKADIADWALGLGAAIVNDVWGLQRDPDMAGVAAAHNAPVIVMHNREQADPEIDIVVDILRFFERSLDIAARAGIGRAKIVLDPGIGFGKTPDQSILVLARLSELKRFELPLLVGASRKRFIDSVVAAPPDRRIGGSIAAHVLAALDGAAIVRAHDVRETVQALRVAEAIRSRS